MSTTKDIASRLANVLEKIAIAAAHKPEKSMHCIYPRLVAVSKTKPISMIVEAYKCGQRHFGENYVMELVEKSNNPDLMSSCPEIMWHFIGRLQRNKVTKLASVARLHMVETVDSENAAITLNKAWFSASSHRPSLAVMLQVNTSREANKGGCELNQVSALSLFVRDQCPNLKIMGLMTIGSVGNSNSPLLEENPDFKCLVDSRITVARALDLDELSLELSMGMSQDYEAAIVSGSTNVRVGSHIFGERDYPGTH